MKHLVEIIQKEEEALRTSAEKLSEFENLKNQAEEMEKEDEKIVEAIQTFEITHLLPEETIQSEEKEGLRHYNRSIFKTQHELDKPF